MQFTLDIEENMELESTFDYLDLSYPDMVPKTPDNQGLIVLHMIICRLLLTLQFLLQNIIT